MAEPQKEGVVVCCRVRPLGSGEGDKLKNERCITVKSNSISIAHDVHSTLTFDFHHVHGETSTNADIYNATTASLVESAMDGIHGSVLCYGQTGSGKTFTMFGDNGVYSQNEGQGLVPRIFTDIFTRATSMSKSEYDVEVRLSCIEIYQDVLYDIIPPSAINTTGEETNTQSKSPQSNPSRLHTRHRIPTSKGKKIGIYESKNGGLLVIGASSCEILNATSGLKLIDLALQRRRVAETEMNRHSSRGHCVVLITIIKRNLSTSTSKIGQLYCVDLAGSEAIGKTRVKGVQLSEAGSINKSLLTLGRVIHALVDSKQHEKKKKNKNKKKNKMKNKIRIPYRDSNLTRLLQNSLGGNARAALVVNVSPALWNMQESISTLRFGASTSKILNKPKQHEVHGIGSLKILLKQCKVQINENSITLKNLEDELLCYQDFFAMIRCVPKSNLPKKLCDQLGNGSVTSEMLLLEERIDVRRRKKMNVAVEEEREEKNSSEGGFLGVVVNQTHPTQKGEEEDSGDEDKDRSSLRTASGGLSALLRTKSFVEKEELEEVQNVLNGDNMGEENQEKEEKECVHVEENNNEINRHLGSLLRTLSGDGEKSD
jgi:kinesin family protein 5